MAFTSGDDINILQPTDSIVVGAGAGNDTYILAQNLLSPGQTVTISDSTGSNTLQLIGGLTITSHKIAAASLQLIMSNGAIVSILGADNFDFKVGGNPLTAIAGLSKSFQTFATESLGATGVPSGNTVINSAGSTVINADGTTAITSTTLDVGSTVKAPWTLLMQGSVGTSLSPRTGGIFASDGSAVGTGLNVLAGLAAYNSFTNGYGVRFKTTDDRSKAYFYDISGGGSSSSTSFSTSGTVGISDGTAIGTKVLMTAVSGSQSQIPSTFATVVGNQLVMAGGSIFGQTAGKLLVSDGTVAGTTLQDMVYSVPGSSGSGTSSIQGINDPVNKVAWFSVSTAPYGSELARFTYGAGTTPSTALVKDIYPGSSSGVGQLSGASLPNGKLVFSADDGVNGSEPWVSDGTATGTFMLADFLPGGSSGPRQLTTFGNKVVFSAAVYGWNNGTVTITAGQELVFTDGTKAGTTVLDVNPGSSSSGPIIIGQVNGLLYFTATTGSTPSQGIYSTNGTTFTRLTDVNNSASLLGFNASKAYFSVSDVTHGAELWTADLVGTGGFALVKDILPGSGSALGQSYNTNSVMVGGKLVFNAYTSATQQNLFVSDGTNTGTLQLSSSLPTVSKVVGSKLVFATADGVYGVDVASTTPSALKLVSGVSTGALGDLFSTYPRPSLMQTDADQVFFKTNNGDLYATNGSTSGTFKLAGLVENFKVVAENAIFFVRDSATIDAALWYSDGTSAGTRFVEALPTNFSYDLDNAVAVTTVGVPS